MNAKILVIIPARGGSKGIPRKNLVMLQDRPLLSYSIDHALRTACIDRVVVSTDDQEIGTVAQAYGAEVVWRPDTLSTDQASSESALLHTLDYLKDKEQYEPDLVVFLQATSPLRDPNDVQNAIDLLLEENADSLFSSCVVEGFVWRTTEDMLTPVDYNPGKRPRRQDLKEMIVEENGSIYIFRPWVLREKGSRLGGQICHYDMPRAHSFQIDDPQDLAFMRQLFALEKYQAPTFDILQDIHLIIFDFDGVFTNNTVVVDQNGIESVVCSRSDGFGIASLRKLGFDMLVISTEKNPVVASRCQKLKLPYFQGCDDKLTKLQEIVTERGLDPARIVYVGNDVNDLACMEWVGIPISVADGVPEIKRVARLMTTKMGGEGAVREVADWIIQARS